VRTTYHTIKVNGRHIRWEADHYTSWLTIRTRGVEPFEVDSLAEAMTVLRRVLPTLPAR
jgi:hypothetical protein